MQHPVLRALSVLLLLCVTDAMRPIGGGEAAVSSVHVSAAVSTLDTTMDHERSDQDQGTALDADNIDKKHKKHKKHKNPFKAPVGYFIQERASKQLPGPGQHFQFGALRSWDTVLDAVANTPDTKLLLLVRHGQAVSNWLQDTLGPDIWFDVEERCTYNDKNGTIYTVFDAELTELGQDQGRYLNSILAGGGWFSKMTGGLPARAIVSPLSRCLQTSLLVSEGLPIERFSVEETARETLGEDTCDARRSVSDPGSSGKKLEGPCKFSQGLVTRFPQFEFPVLPFGPSVDASLASGFGLTSDADTLWTEDRETQKQQIKRASAFLHKVFNNATEQVIVVFTHSGFTRSILLAMGREPYRPQNTELVPAIVTRLSTPEDWEEEADEEHEEGDADEVAEMPDVEADEQQAAQVERDD